MIDRMRGVGVLAAAVSMMTAGLLHADEEHHWSYQGATGPSHWAAMEHEYATCGIGKTQSPIDIEDAAAKKSDLPPIAFDYKPSPLKIIDNGHTIQVNYAPGSSITVQGKRTSSCSFTSTSLARRGSTARATTWWPTSCTRIRTAISPSLRCSSRSAERTSRSRHSGTRCRARRAKK